LSALAGLYEAGHCQKAALERAGERAAIQ
jgi:hypothetical protein